MKGSFLVKEKTTLEKKNELLEKQLIVKQPAGYMNRKMRRMIAKSRGQND